MNGKLSVRQKCGRGMESMLLSVHYGVSRVSNDLCHLLVMKHAQPCFIKSKSLQLSLRKF